jgi:hypothetical protein
MAAKDIARFLSVRIDDISATSLRTTIIQVNCRNAMTLKALISKRVSSNKRVSSKAKVI